MKKAIKATILGAVLFAGTAVPAFASHDHHLDTPGGCTTIPVWHQEHGLGDPGKKVHGGLHTGVPGTFAFGQAGVVSVAGGACAD